MVAKVLPEAVAVVVVGDNGGRSDMVVFKKCGGDVGSGRAWAAVWGVAIFRRRTSAFLISCLRMIETASKHRPSTNRNRPRSFASPQG